MLLCLLLVELGTDCEQARAVPLTRLVDASHAADSLVNKLHVDPVRTAIGGERETTSVSGDDPHMKLRRVRPCRQIVFAEPDEISTVLGKPVIASAFVAKNLSTLSGRGRRGGRVILKVSHR